MEKESNSVEELMLNMKKLSYFNCDDIISWLIAIFHVSFALKQKIPRENIIYFFHEIGYPPIVGCKYITVGSTLKMLVMVNGKKLVGKKCILFGEKVDIVDLTSCKMITIREALYCIEHYR